MFKISYLIFITIVLFSCKNCQNSKTNTITNNELGSTIGNIHNNRIENLINIIEASNCVYGKGVGIAGKPNQTYEAFSELNNLASDSLLFKLTYHNNTILKIYAYKALVERNSNLAKKVQDRLKFDTATFCNQINDISFNCSVSNYVIKVKPPAISSVQ